MTMFLIDYKDVLSILPPIIAVLLALKYKDVISSLLVGILCGSFIYSNGNIIKTIEVTFEIMINKIESNAEILAFLSILGILVTIISISGGSYAYGKFVTKKIKNKNSAQIATAILGIIIFIDDYFNCLTVGTVMRPITDKYCISREKLAYIIDSIAAPICMITPISSWGVTIASTLEATGVENGMNILISTIPLNIYPILTIFVVFIVCITNFSAIKIDQNKNHSKDDFIEQNEYENNKIENINISRKGETIDLVIPIFSLIIGTIFFMIYTGYSNANAIGITINVLDTFGWASTTISLIYGGFISLLISFLLYISRNIISVSEFISSIPIGVKSMVPSFLILIMSWTISGICGSNYLDTGKFISSFLYTNSIIPTFLFPVLFFVISGILSFSTGTSWGTIALIIPIAFSVCHNMKYIFLISVFAAVLSGSVFGDHISPISDTTILSSTGSNCDHIKHITTQIPYAIIVSLCSIVGYLMMGICCEINMSYAYTIIITVLSSFSILFVILLHINKKYNYKW